jgi:hypothetical protein
MNYSKILIPVLIIVTAYLFYQHRLQHSQIATIKSMINSIISPPFSPSCVSPRCVSHRAPVQRTEDGAQAMEYAFHGGCDPDELFCDKPIKTNGDK